MGKDTLDRAIVFHGFSRNAIQGKAIAILFTQRADNGAKGV
jgi:hypothetical protein